MLDIVSVSYCVPPYVPQGDVVLDVTSPDGGDVGATDASLDGVTVAARAADRVDAVSVGAELIAHPGERGFDDDEDPVPPKA